MISIADTSSKKVQDHMMLSCFSLVEAAACVSIDLLFMHLTPNSEVENELAKVATFYRDAGAIYPAKDANSNLRAVYFVKLNFEESTREIFMKVF